MPGYKNPDLEYLDQQGNVVGYGEVKTVGDADQSAFNKQLAKAVKQLRVREDVEGKMDVNEIFIQVPDLVDAREVRGWFRSYQKGRLHHGSDLEKISGYHVRVYTGSGSKLADVDLGVDADGGHYDESTHTYYSSNGYSY
ncbi:hypothetical protein [Streptomyces sp. NPDC101237]|uniref:hypothetical protein n=1 Tax=Streptomyces sp. NPDC101237 TaxID=3366139 RepID=UPI00381B679C